MVSIFKIHKQEILPTGVYGLVELRGLSTDTKPTEINGMKVDNGSSFIEIDTGKTIYYDLENTEWSETPADDNQGE